MSKKSRLAVGSAVAVAALGVASVDIATTTGQAAQTPPQDKGRYNYDGRPQSPEEVTQAEFEQRTKALDEASQRPQPDFGIEHLDESTP